LFFSLVINLVKFAPTLLLFFLMALFA
jgi:hypothetical protein